MPTYTIDYGGAQDGWANAASALANALTPDIEGEANARLMAAQAQQNYAGAYANEQLARQRGAAAALDERELGVWQELDATMANEGFTPEERQEIFVTEFLPRLGKVDGANVGDWNLAIGGMQGADDATLSDLFVGAGGDYANSPEGFNLDQRRQSQQFIMGEQGELARQRESDAAEMERLRFQTFNDPVAVGENQTILFGTEDPRFRPGGVQGQRSVGVNEAIIPPGGTEADMIAGPQFTPKAPDAPTSRTITEGLDTVTQEWDGTKWVEVARGPRSSDSGKTVLDPMSEVFTADTVATLTSALDGGRDAALKIGELDETMAYLQQGVPSGFWTDATMPIRQALTGLGIFDEAETARIEKITSDLGNRVMQRIQETKGAVSNAEMDYFRKISASIGKTPAGNLLLLEKERRVWERAQRMRNYALSLRDQNLTEKQISDALEAWRNDPRNALFTPQELADIEALTPNPELGYEVAAPGTRPAADPFADLDTSAYD